MKVIDLYVKMANGEEVPKKIKYEDKLYIFSKEIRKYYRFDEDRFGVLNDSFEDDWYLASILNDEVEIIEDTPEENKKIEKISLDDWVEFTTPGDIKRIDYIFNKNFKTFVDKINEIIKVINGE